MDGRYYEMDRFIQRRLDKKIIKTKDHYDGKGGFICTINEIEC